MLIVGMVLGCSQPVAPSLAMEESDSAVEASNPPAVVAESATIWSPKKLAAKHLPNLVQIHPRVMSGGLPEGDAAFQELSDLGVKTIISVDGAKPDVETARKFGLRYVHLPHGYDGIPDERVKQLAKAVRDLEGPLYVHCHHGKHRSPAAASVACVAAGLISPSAAISVLALAGTSPNYRGLYLATERAQPLGSPLLDELDVDFQEIVDVPPMAMAMVSLEHTHDHIKALSEAGWRTPQAHPDLEPAHEALLLQEHFSELLRTDEVGQQTKRFRELLQDSELAAVELASELRKWRTVVGDQRPPALLGQLAERISTNCQSCHQAFRDTPLRESK